MRKLILTAALAFAVVPGLAFAQSDENDENTGGGDDESMTEGGATVAPEKKSSPSSTGKASSPGTQHTVERGDTLWDLSQKYLGSPWYWPKVWSYNPEIANPHWIYPGNEVRFFGSGEEVPTQVEVGTEKAVEESDLYDGAVSVAGDIGFRPKNSVSVQLPGFVTNREIEESGRIVGSFAESAELTFADHIYIKFAKKAPRLGEIYVIYRNGGEVIHPVTKSPIGHMTYVMAEVKVIRVDKDNHGTVQVWKQYDEVLRGDLVGPAPTEPIIRQVAARPNERDVKEAVVVADTRLYPTLLGEHQTVIIDKGADDGVKVGNVFTVFRQHDPLPVEALLQPSRLEEQYPTEDIGQCVAFEVKAKATICLVSRSLRDIVRGDHCEIRASGSRRASR